MKKLGSIIMVIMSDMYIDVFSYGNFIMFLTLSCLSLVPFKVLA